MVSNKELLYNLIIVQDDIAEIKEMLVKPKKTVKKTIKKGKKDAEK